MLDGTCAQERFFHLLYWNYVMAPMLTIGLVIMFICLYQFIMTHIRSESKSTKSSRSFFYLSLAHYIVLILYFINKIINFVSHCRNGSVTFVTDRFSQYFYFIQAYCLLFILVVRLVAIFKGTAYALPNTTILFTAVAIVLNGCVYLTSLSVSVFSTQSHVRSIALLVLAFSAVIGICMIIACNIVFIRKLRIVHASSMNAASNQQGLLTVITKTAILCFMSTWITFIFLIMYFAQRLAGITNVHFHLFYQLVVFSDLSTNFLCVLLTTKHFDKWYYCLCSCCHRRLMIYCSVHERGTNVQMAKQDLDSIQAVSPDSR